MRRYFLVCLVFVGITSCQDTVAVYEPYPTFLNPMGAPFKMIDAAFYRADIKSYYFFQGSEYIITDTEGNMRTTNPEAISDGFGIPASWDAINSAFYDELQQEIWLFRGSECISFKTNDLKSKNPTQEITRAFGVPKNWTYIESVFYTTNDQTIFLFNKDQFTKVRTRSKNVVLTGYPKLVSTEWFGYLPKWGVPDLFFGTQKGVRACKQHSCVWIDTACETCMKKVNNNPISLLAISWGFPIRWTESKIGYLQFNLLQSLAHTHDPDGSDDIQINFQNGRGDKLGCKLAMTSGKIKNFPSVYIPCEDSVSVSLRVGDEPAQFQTIKCLGSTHYTIFTVDENTATVDLIGDIGSAVADSMASVAHQIAANVITTLLKFVAKQASGQGTSYALKMFVGVDQTKIKVSSQTELCSEALYSGSACLEPSILIILLSFILLVLLE